MYKILFAFALPLLLLLWVSPVRAQINISGKVTNAASGRAVRQASISINHKGVGTATNSQGLFTLIIPAGNIKDSLKISCVGYITRYIAIAKTKNNQELNVALTKSNTELKEVTIAYYDADKIIQKAITRIPDNYINYRHVLRGFYRMYTYTDSIPLQLSEAVFDVYNFGYGDTHADLFRLVKARNEKNDPDFNTLEIAQRPNSIFEQDIINHLHACGFLNEEGLKHHQFTVNGVVDIKGYKAYEIEFKEKYGAVEGTYRGKFYIDTKTYAFIYFDFGLSPEALSEVVPGTFAYRSLIRTGATEVGLQFDHTQVSYQEVGNKWVLSGVEGDDSLAVKNPQLKYNYVAHVKYNYQITAVDTIQQESFTAKIGRNDNINAYKSNGDEKFWKDYNILLSDYDAADIFKKIKAINKSK
ncbi:MAG: carboxypeptidase-like regulatory domain-containing protein [Bacteroidota bacterium]